LAKRSHARHEVGRLAAGVPAYRSASSCEQSRYRKEKQVITCCSRNVMVSP
jgi:hypothetical protein